MKFKTSRLGLYIVITGWLAFLVIISQAFQWTDFDTALMSLFSFEPNVLPLRAIALAIPLILTIIGYLVYEREKFLGEMISTGRRLESKNISLETSYKKLYGKMKEGVAGSAHTMLLEESRLMIRGGNAVFSDVLEYRIRHLTEEASHVLREDQMRFRTIMLLHEALMRCTEPGKVDVRGYLRAVGANIIDTCQVPGVRLDVEVKGAGMSINTLFPCGMIVCELVMNSLKHAFANVEEPVVNISLQLPPKGRAVLSVMDNGSGIPEGMDLSAIDTMGLKMVNRMARTMKADVDREQGVQGTSYAITFNPSGRLPE